MVRHVSAASEIGLDFETSGNRYKAGARIVGATIGYLDANSHPCAWYVPVGHATYEPQADPHQARAAFRDACRGAKSIVGHNLKFDLNFGRADDFVIPETADLHCTYIQAHLNYERRALDLETLCANEPGASLWPDPYEMKTLVEAYCADRAKMRKLPLKKDKYPKWCYLTRFGHSEVPIALEAEYSCRDVAHTLLLDRKQRARALGAGTEFETQARWLYTNEMVLVRALADMGWHGQPIDLEYIEAYANELDIDLEQRAVGLNQAYQQNWDVDTWANDNRVRELLYSDLKLPIVRMTEPEHGEPQPSVDRSALLTIAKICPDWKGHLELLGEFGARAKVQSTYTRSLAWRAHDDGRIHPDVRQPGTRTGRLSMSPNLQNIPTRHKELAKRVRTAFVIDPGYARLYVDYSQVELRILAWVTGNRTLIDAYRSPSWDHMMRSTKGNPSAEWHDWWIAARKSEAAVDVHALQAKRTFGVDETHPDWKNKRDAAKRINFGIPYGMGPAGLQGNPELMLSKEDAETYFAQYHKANPETNASKRSLFRKMLNRRGVPRFVNWCGRTVHGPGMRSDSDEIRSAEERSMFASVVQGSAAELTRISIVRLWQLAKSGELPAIATSTIHDEIQLDCKIADLPEVARIAQRTSEAFYGLFGSVPIVCALESSQTTWADKKHLE